MTLPYRQERLVRRADRVLRRSDPDLASMLSIFARLTAAEGMPAREQLRLQPASVGEPGQAGGQGHLPDQRKRIAIADRLLCARAELEKLDAAQESQFIPAASG